MPTLWAEMLSPDLEGARESLRSRERTNLQEIAVWPGTSTYLHSDVIAAWGTEMGFEGVVWTALGPKFDEQEGRTPTQCEVLQYLNGLVASGYAANAEEYVRKAPAQVRTPYREAIERELNWMPLP